MLLASQLGVGIPNVTLKRGVNLICFII